MVEEPLELLLLLVLLRELDEVELGDDVEELLILVELLLLELLRLLDEDEEVEGLVLLLLEGDVEERLLVEDLLASEKEDDKLLLLEKDVDDGMLVTKLLVFVTKEKGLLLLLLLGKVVVVSPNVFETTKFEFDVVDKGGGEGTIELGGNVLELGVCEFVGSSSKPLD